MKHLFFYCLLLVFFVRCGGTGREETRQYEAALDKGNTYWAQSKYQEAKTYYTQALKLRPNDGYIKNRLVAIDSLLAQQKTEQKPPKKKLLPPKEYAFEDSFVEGFARVKNGKKWGYIDQNKQEITELKYDEAAHFSGGFARVRLKEKFGFIDTTGKEIVPPKTYEKAGKFGEEGLAFVMKIDEKNKEDKYGYVDTSGKETIDLKYDWAGNFSEARAKVSLGNKFGFIDPKGEEVIALEYDGARNFKNELAAVWKNRKWGFIDDQGKTIIPFKYDRVEDFRNKKYKDRYGNKKEGVLALVVMEGKTFYIDKKGKCVVDCED